MSDPLGRLTAIASQGSQEETHDDPLASLRQMAGPSPSRPSTPSPKNESVPISQQIKGYGEQVYNFFRHPIQSVEGIGKGIADAAYSGFAAPVEGQKRAESDYLRGKGVDVPEIAKPGEVITKANTPGAISPETMRSGELNTAINTGFLFAPPLAAPLRVAVNAGLGAFNDKEQRIRGALTGATIGEVLHTALGKIGKGGEGEVAAKTQPEVQPLEALKQIAEITPEQADAINVGHRTVDNAPAGEVTATPDRIAHIWENPSRRTQLEGLGYTSAEHFLHDIGGGFTHIYDTGDNSIALVRYMPDGRAIWANLAGSEAPEWRLGSGAPTPEGKFDNKALLWPANQPNGPDTGNPGNFSPTRINDSQSTEGAGFTVPQQRSSNIPQSSPVAPEAAGRPSDILNVAKLNLEDQTAQQRVANQLEQFRTLKEQNKQTFAEADINRAEIIKELTANDPKALVPAMAKRLSGEELLARRDVVRQNDQLITELSKSIESKQLSVADHEQATQLMQKALEHNDALLSDLVVGSSQKGRDLNLLRRIADRNLDPDVWQIQAKRMLGDKPLTDEIAASIRKLSQAAIDACGGA